MLLIFVLCPRHQLIGAVCFAYLLSYVVCIYWTHFVGSSILFVLGCFYAMYVHTYS